MSKKKIVLIVIGLLILIGIISSSGKENNKKSPSTGEQKISQQPTQNLELPILSPVPTSSPLPTSSPIQKKLKYAVLSGVDNDPKSDTFGEIIVQEINIWEKAGSGGRNNMSIGNVPHNTKVEVIESKEVEGVTFYHIRSSIGNVSVLPTDFDEREKAMKKKPKEEWYVPADETFPVEGWVIDDFVTDLQ